MEKMRYYVELPADIWDDGYFVRLIRQAQPVPASCVDAKKMNLLREHQVWRQSVLVPHESVS